MINTVIMDNLQGFNILEDTNGDLFVNNKGAEVTDYYNDILIEESLQEEEF